MDGWEQKKRNGLTDGQKESARQPTHHWDEFVVEGMTERPVSQIMAQTCNLHQQNFSARDSELRLMLTNELQKDSRQVCCA